VSRLSIIPKLKRRKILDAIASGKRMDGRGLEEYREISVRRGVVEKAEGSAEARIGDTWVVAGVKIEIGEPFEDTPDEGILVCSADFAPVASPTFEPGPPDEASIELARVVDRGIRSSDALSLKDLCLIPGRKVYVIYIDLCILNHAGNLLDAASLAAVAALMGARKPIYEVRDGEVYPTGEVEPLKLRRLPIAVSMAKIGDAIVLDPTFDEEEVMDTRITVTVDEEGNICAVQKSGPQGLSVEEIWKAIEIAVNKAPKLREKLEAAL